MEKNRAVFPIDKDNKTNYILFFSFFSAWLLAFPFLGHVLYGLYSEYSVGLDNLPLIIIAFLFIGHISAGYLIDDIKKAKKALVLISYICILGSLVFFLPYSSLWGFVILILSFMGGVYVSTWGYYAKLYAHEFRVKSIGLALILSNIIMVWINIVSINISPFLGLGLCILSLLLGLVFLQKTRVKIQTGLPQNTNTRENLKSHVLLYFFITTIAITSGLMYTVINPAFGHHRVLSSFYWALPYILVIYILIKSLNKVNRGYILYLAILLIGLSFLMFLVLDKSWLSYIVVNTLMMSGFGVCDLFWWSIIGELLDYVKNPAKLFGVGLSANLLGIFIGCTIGTKFINTYPGINPSLLALAIVFIILMILPFLNKYLSQVIEDHIFLFKLYNREEKKMEEAYNPIKKYPKLTDRENEIVNLLCTGRTYKMIAEDLYLSENTVKSHIKNIYSKYSVQSKSQLIKILQDMF